MAYTALREWPPNYSVCGQKLSADCGGTQSHRTALACMLTVSCDFNSTNMENINIMMLVQNQHILGSRQCRRLHCVRELGGVFMCGCHDFILPVATSEH